MQKHCAGVDINLSNFKKKSKELQGSRLLLYIITRVQCDKLMFEESNLKNWIETVAGKEAWSWKACLSVRN